MMEGYNGVSRNQKGEPEALPAKSRFSDPQALRAVYDKLTEEDAPEAARRAKLRNMYDGNLPYNPDKLRSCALRNLTNVNFLGLKGVIDARADALAMMESDTSNLIELRPLARELAGPDAVRVASIVAEEFSATIRETGKVIPALSMMHTESDLYGLGPIAWPDSIDYNPIALERGQLRFIGDGPVVSSEHELFMFESTLQASYMFYLLDNAGVAAGEGWNLDAVKRWLVDAFANGVESGAQPGVESGTTYIEQQLALYRQNRFQEEHQFDRLKVIHAFVREMYAPRAITHIIVPASEQKEFLFVKPGAYQTMDQCLLWFPHSFNYRYARAVRGLASFLYSVEALNNRFTCQMVDVAFRASSFVLSQKGAGAQPNLTINEQGPYTVIPQEFTPAQSQVAPNFQQLASVKQMLDSAGATVATGSAMGPLGTTSVRPYQGPDRPTKAEVEIQQRLRSRKDEALFVRKLFVLDKVFRETFRRFIRLAVSGDPLLVADYPEIPVFIERCARRGVAPDVLAQVPSMYTVVTCRDLVLGGEGKVGVLTDVLTQFGGNLDESGRRAATRDMVQLRLGQAAADRYTPEGSRDAQPSDAASFATVENDMIRSHQTVMVGPDQLHWSHIPIHAQLLQEIVEQVQAPEDNSPESGQGPGGSIAEETLQRVEDPKSTLQTLVSCSQHIQEHLAIGGQQIGMQAQAKQVAKMLRDLRPTIKALNLAVATQERVEQAEREKQEREMEELRRQADQNELEKEKYKADRQAEIGRYKADLDHDVALRRLGLESQVASARENRADQQAAGDERRRDRETSSRIDADERISQARVNAANAVNRMNAVQEVTGFGHMNPTDVIPEQGELDFSSL